MKALIEYATPEDLIAASPQPSPAAAEDLGGLSAFLRLLVRAMRDASARQELARRASRRVPLWARPFVGMITRAVLDLLAEWAEEGEAAGARP